MNKHCQNVQISETTKTTKITAGKRAQKTQLHRRQALQYGNQLP